MITYRATILNVCMIAVCTAPLQTRASAAEELPHIKTMQKIYSSIGKCAVALLSIKNLKGALPVPEEMISSAIELADQGDRVLAQLIATPTLKPFWSTLNQALDDGIEAVKNMPSPNTIRALKNDSDVQALMAQIGAENAIPKQTLAYYAAPYKPAENPLPKLANQARRMQTLIASKLHNKPEDAAFVDSLEKTVQGIEQTSQESATAWPILMGKDNPEIAAYREKNDKLLSTFMTAVLVAEANNKLKNPAATA